MARRYTKRRTRTKRRKGGGRWFRSFRMPWSRRNTESSWVKNNVPNAPLSEEHTRMKEEIATHTEHLMQKQREEVEKYNKNSKKLDEIIKDQQDHVDESPFFNHTGNKTRLDKYNDAIDMLARLKLIKQKYKVGHDDTEIRQIISQSAPAILRKITFH